MRIGAAEEDSNRQKAFDCNTSGEVLGIWFNTVDMSFKLPVRKLEPFILLVKEVISKETLTIHEVEVVHGKLNHLVQLAPPLKRLIGEVVQELRDFLD